MVMVILVSVLTNREVLDVVRVRDVCIILLNRNVWTLQKVRHISKLNKNRISIEQLDDDGYLIVFSGDTWKVTKSAMVLACSQRTVTLYMTSGPSDMITVIEAKNNTTLWHCRPGHMSQKRSKTHLTNLNLGKQKGVNFAVSHEFEFVSLDELLEITVQSKGVSDGESGSDAPIPIVLQADLELSTHAVVVRRSSKITRPLQRFSPILNYILLTDGGELQSYDEILQDENLSMWKLALKNKMDSLLGNRT